MADEKKGGKKKTASEKIKEQIDAVQNTNLKEGVPPATAEVDKPDVFKELMEKKGLNPDSPEDRAKFAQIYADMESKSSHNGEEMAKLKGEMEWLKANPAQTTPQQPDQDPLDGFRPYYEEDPLRATMDIVGGMVSQQLKPIFEKNRKREIKDQKTALRTSQSDFGDYEKELDTQLKSIPLGKEIDPSLVGNIYFQLRGKKVDEIARKAEEKGKLEAQQTGEMKSQAFMEGAGKTPATPPPDTNKMTSAELKKYINSLAGSKR